MMARDAMLLAQHVGWTDYHVVGMSMGEAAHTSPARHSVASETCQNCFERAWQARPGPVTRPDRSLIYPLRFLES